MHGVWLGRVPLDASVRERRVRDVPQRRRLLSFQDSTREMNDFLSHTKTFELKNRVAKIIKSTMRGRRSPRWRCWSCRTSS